MKPPSTEAELQTRVRHLAGRSVGELARRFHMPIPESSRRGKGFIGQVLERALGASAGSRAEPDFPLLGIELKSLPVKPNGRPSESTFVTTLPLARITEQPFAASAVGKKLSRVLFVAIEAEGQLTERRVGRGVLWSPSDAQKAQLQRDYDRIVNLVLDGRHDEITGHLGDVLQVRPKGADAQSSSLVMDADGYVARTGSRGFYLRPAFTQAIIANALNS